MGIEIFNKTPHDIVMYIDQYPVQRFKPSGSPWRLDEVLAPSFDFDLTEISVPVRTSCYSTPIGFELPPCRKGVYYIVSNPFRIHYSYRTDLFGVGDFVRDNEGVVIGAKMFIQNEGNL